MTYEEWKQEMTKLSDETIEVGRKMIEHIEKLSELESVNVHEALGFIVGEQSRVESSVEKLRTH